MADSLESTARRPAWIADLAGRLAASPLLCAKGTSTSAGEPLVATQQRECGVLQRAHMQRKQAGRLRLFSPMRHASCFALSVRDHIATPTRDTGHTREVHGYTALGLRQDPLRAGHSVCYRVQLILCDIIDRFGKVRWHRKVLI